MGGIARFAIKHRWLILAGWIAAIALIQVGSSAVGGAEYKDDFKLPGTEIQEVFDLLEESGFSQENNAVGTMVLHRPNRAGALEAEPAGFLGDAEAAVCHVEEARVTTITTPWGSVACAPDVEDSATARPDLLSPDKSVALAEVVFAVAQPEQKTPKAAYEALKTLRSDSLGVEFTGATFEGVDKSEPVLPPEILGLIAALLILAVVFRTLGTSVLPLLCAGFALLSCFGLVALLSHVMTVADWTPNLAALMVIGVGVDYALFIVTRHRRNLQRGMSVEDSIVSALNTSGRAVLFAGVTVCIAILGLCALGVSFLYGVAFGTSLGVALTMVAAITLLPALLSLLGRRALPRSQREALPSDRRVKLLLCAIPPLCVVFWILYGLEAVMKPLSARLAARRGDAAFWQFWAKFGERRALALGALAVVVLVVLSIPFLSLRLGSADQRTAPAGSTTRTGFELIQDEFGKGYNSTLDLVVSGPGAGDEAFIEEVATSLAAVENVDKASVLARPATDELAFIGFKSVTGPQDTETVDLVKSLRADVIPGLVDDTDTDIYVYGETAVTIDFSGVLAAKMPYFFVAVVGLSFLLLMVAFRSLVIPATAAAMNLLAATASFGILVAVFQWGWLGDALGVGAGGPIEAFMPVLFFAILFGLSMDYQVFLVSRIHEEWVHTGDNARSVRVGLGETGGIITAAGLIMITVFAGFALSEERVLQMLGIGLASAVFLDAFIVRTMLVPSVMHRLGKSNWWYPRWLGRITPRVSIEPPESRNAAPPNRGHCGGPPRSPEPIKPSEPETLPLS